MAHIRKDNLIYEHIHSWGRDKNNSADELVELLFDLSPVKLKEEYYGTIYLNYKEKLKELEK